MIAFLDVDYRDAGAVAAAVLACDWADAAPAAEVVAHIPVVAEYVPGEFYRRELPCLLAVLDRCPQPPDVLVVDGYVWLGPDRPGLGARLFEALGRRTPVVGVGKTCFRSAAGVATPVYRAGSNQALWVTAAGLDPAAAAVAVRDMHGPHRLPTLIKRVDHLCRNA
ncbi:MAG TPA: endonuclease V [Gemmataceae bacterium]|nr:endonuclease V [Gemmataceae bacterium]